jgi:hypothetical protein
MGCVAWFEGACWCLAGSKVGCGEVEGEGGESCHGILEGREGTVVRVRLGP